MTSYVFVVPSDAVARFLEINSRAAVIYRKHGALASTMLTLADGETRYGCMGLNALLRLRSDERAFCVQDECRDEQHFREVLQAVETETEIEALFCELNSLIDFRRAHRAEWRLSPPDRKSRL